MKKLVTLAVLALLASAPQNVRALTDGTPSTATLTVNTPAALIQAAATGSITIVDTASLSGAFVSVGPYRFVAGRDFAVGSTLAITASNLAAAITASAVPVSASASSAVVSLTADDAGSGANAISLTTSNTAEMTVSGATLSGGQNNAVVTINGVSLTQGRDWLAFTDAQTTAVSLAAAINRNHSIDKYVSAYWTGTSAGVIQLRSVLLPLPYSLSVADNSATNANLTPSGSAFSGGSAGLIQAVPCYLGQVDVLPTSGYPAGCIAYLTSDATHLYVSTQSVVGSQSWLAK